MNSVRFFIFLFLLLPIIIVSCAVRAERKSAEYYQENKTDIQQMRNYFETLYKQQPFSAGFTDPSCTYYVMEVTTDTLRSIFNTEKSEKQLFETIQRFHYDTSLLRQLAAKMKKIKCLWLGKTSFYINGIKDTITFLSFRSTFVEKPFVENKYYVLLFLNHEIDTPEARARIKKGEFVKVDDLVYFTIASGFR